MARLGLTLTLLFLFFAFTYARTPFIPENDVTDRDLSDSLPESDAKSTLVLPSDKLEPEEQPSPVVELDSETAETKPIDTENEDKAVGTTEDLPESDRETVTVPLDRPMKIVRFRPINRHFPAKRSYPFHIPLRGCRHGIKHMMKRREVGYGGDMIMAGGGGERQGKEFDPEMLHGGVRQIPERWVRFHHHHHHHDGMQRFPFGKHHRDVFGKKSFRRPFHREEDEDEEEREEKQKKSFRRPFRREEDDDEEEREEKQKKGQRKEREEGSGGGGFMKHIRKFLDQF
ncbi:hypothetical protein LOK49_LG13G01029 [Camellia lanceoleosa]|uniref:Uncharacterized protein n=1 Tax=Camellia lanceoleosa TaxID=1840588 RepID=A0ACC0FQ32_9ERIC|nr:hypothetical protein LOK49_LG13G01029 [Camellia lanceoleosa]